VSSKSRRSFLKSCLWLAASAFASFASLPIFAFAPRKNCYASGLNNAFPGETRGSETKFKAGYVALHRTGELKKRGDALWQKMDECRLCPRECGAARLAGEKGYCQSSAQVEIAAFHPHFGEERSLVGEGGSGTVFFTNCSLRCVFCINWEISQGGYGEEESLTNLAEMMLDLQRRGCHNINVVTPTHYSPHIVKALDIAADRGLQLPVVYNTCGWERLEILELLDGIVDIYLPDFKYADGARSAKYSSGADTYPEFTQQALREMFRQVGVAKPARDGLMYRGLMIRHLVMPDGVADSKQVLAWIAKNLPLDTYVNIMSQYRPMYKAFDYPEISRRITRQEYREVVRYAKKLGFTNLDIQG